MYAFSKSARKHCNLKAANPSSTMALFIGRKSTLILITCHIVWLAHICSANNFMSPDWIDPHSWDVEPNELTQLCPQAASCEPCEPTAKAEYLRLVQSLFNPNEFRYDDATGFLYRTVHIHVTKEQLEVLRESRDPRHVDGLLSEVLAQTSFGTVQLVKEYSIDVAAELWRRMPNMDVRAVVRSRSICINVLLLVAIYFTCRRYNISYMVTLLFAAIYCLYEYLDYECHRRIELDMQIDLIYGAEVNPCSASAKNNWYDWLVGKDSRSRCREFLAKNTHNENQCGVIDLFHEFTMNVLLKQMKIFFVSIADMVQSISATNGIIVTAITFYFMKDILAEIVRSLFKYIFNPAVWSRVYADTTAPPNPHYAHPNPLAPPNPPNPADFRTFELELPNQRFRVTFGNSGVDVLTSGMEAITLEDRPSSTSTISSIECPSRSSGAGSSGPSDQRHELKQRETDSSTTTSEDGQDRLRDHKKRPVDQHDQKPAVDQEDDDDTSIKMECNARITSNCELIEISSDTCSSSIDDFTDGSSLAPTTPPTSPHSESRSTSLGSDIEILSNDID